MGHRGNGEYSHRRRRGPHFRENTIRSFQEAILRGVTWLEFGNVYYNQS